MDFVVDVEIFVVLECFFDWDDVFVVFWLECGGYCCVIDCDGCGDYFLFVCYD